MAEEQCRYNNATKATWRGWAWNQAGDRVPENSLVLALCGKTAEDHFAAKKRNLRCIGIDRDQDCVKNFRKNGGVAVNASLSSQVALLKPDFVIADFVCGLTPSAMGQMVDVALLTLGGVFNFLRGRDKGVVGVNQTMKVFDGRRFKDEFIGKHRGKLAWCSLINLLQKEGIEFTLEHLRKARPKFFSYRSKDGGQFFDSVVFSSVWSCSLDERNLRSMFSKKEKAVAAAAIAVMNRK